MRPLLLAAAAAVSLPACVRGMGDCVPAVPPPAFCDMINYNVTKDIHTPIPDPHNIKELDDIAKDIYFTAIEVRPPTSPRRAAPPLLSNRTADRARRTSMSRARSACTP